MYGHRGLTKNNILEAIDKSTEIAKERGYEWDTIFCHPRVAGIVKLIAGDKFDVVATAGCEIDKLYMTRKEYFPTIRTMQNDQEEGDEHVDHSGL